jgi:hypothetical protein
MAGAATTTRRAAGKATTKRDDDLIELDARATRARARLEAIRTIVATSPYATGRASLLADELANQGFGTEEVRQFRRLLAALPDATTQNFPADTGPPGSTWPVPWFTPASALLQRLGERADITEVGQVPSLLDIEGAEQPAEKGNVVTVLADLVMINVVWRTFAAGVDASLALIERAPTVASKLEQALLAAADRAAEAAVIETLVVGAPVAASVIEAMAQAGTAARCSLDQVLVVGGPGLAPELVALAQAGFSSNVVFTSETGDTIAAIAAPGVAVLLSDPITSWTDSPSRGGRDVAVGRLVFPTIRRAGAVVTVAAAGG